MKQRITFITHKEKRILLLDFSYVQIEEARLVLVEAKELICQQPERSLLTLTDVTGAHFNREVIHLLRDFVVHNKPYVAAGAVVGVMGIKKVIYNTIMAVAGRKLPTFGTKEEALDWLTGQTN